MALIENLIEKIDPCFLFDRGFENFIPYYLKICQVETRVLIGQYSKGHSSLEAKLEAHEPSVFLSDRPGVSARFKIG